MFMEQHIPVSYAKLFKPIGTCVGKAVFQRRAIFAVCLKQTCCSLVEGESQPLFGKQTSLQ